MIDYFCPVTGLRVFSLPEWINRHVSDTLTANFYVIGNSIIYSVPVGKTDLKGAMNSISLNNEVAKHVSDGKGPYIQIDNYETLYGSTQEGRKYFTRSMNANKRLTSLIFCNLSPILSIAVKIGSRFNTTQKTVHAVKHYSHAIELALKLYDEKNLDKNAFVLDRKLCFDDSGRSLSPVELNSGEAWNIQTPEYSNSAVLIDNCILHSTSVGRLEPEHVPLIERMRRLCKESLPEGSRIEYIVVDSTQLRGANRQARTTYMESLKEWNKQFPFRAYILYGVNTFMRAAALLSRPFMSFQVKIAQDLNHAFSLIRKDRLRDSSAGQSIVEENEVSGSTDEHIEQFLTYIGGIDWEREGVDVGVEVAEGHPLYMAFQSVKLIKDELDDLLAERKRSEEELRKSEVKYRLLAEEMADVIWTANINFQVDYVSPSIEKVLGFTPEERKKQTLPETVKPESLQRMMAVYQEEMRREETQVGDPERSITLEVEYLHKDGSTVWMESHMKAIRDPAGAIIGIHGVSRDISERKRAEKEKLRLEAQLRQAQKMEAIGTLAGGIAHDFNNILAGIMGYTELALMEISRGQPNKEHLEQVLSCSLRAKKLIEQILSFSRRAEQERKLLQIGPVIKEAMKLLRASLPTTIEIEQELEEGPGTVLADPTQIHQLLMNLCTNAAHAMQERGGVLKVRLERMDLDRESAAEYGELSPGAYNRLSISDTGEGMDRETMDRVFEPFFTTKETGQGTGMGLAVVHGIVKAHGGAITVHSEPGKGSSFQVCLPLKETEAEEEAAAETKPLPTGTERVLFVDDEETLVDIGRHTLELLGYRVTCRTSSIEALEVFKSRPSEFDLVITDQTMPKMTGVDLAQALLAIRPDIPIIVCTGYSARISAQMAEEVGIKRMLMKPLVSREVAQAMREVLEKV